MNDEVKEAIGIVLAALKVQTMLLQQAQKLSWEDRQRVTSDLARRKDQEALDLWSRACDAT